jgi:hypothetical protein
VEQGSPPPSFSLSPLLHKTDPTSDYSPHNILSTTTPTLTENVGESDDLSWYRPSILRDEVRVVFECPAKVWYICINMYTYICVCAYTLSDVTV